MLMDKKSQSDLVWFNLINTNVDVDVECRSIAKHKTTLTKLSNRQIFNFNKKTILIVSDSIREYTAIHEVCNNVV